MQLSSAAQQRIEQWSNLAFSHALLPYQRRYSTDSSRKILWKKSRRIGVTYANAFKSVVKRALRKPGLTPIDHLFSSKDEKSSAEWLGYCYSFSEQLNTLLGEELIPLSRWTSEVGYYANECRAITLSSNPKAFRSMQGDVTLDEFDFHEQQEEIYKSAQPCLMWFPDEASIELISSISKTPGTRFKNFIVEAEQGSKSWGYYKITLADAVGEGLALKVWKKRIPEFRDRYGDNWLAELNAAFIQSIREECATEEDFLQEYCCEAPNSSALITDAQYDALILKGPDGKPIPVPDTLLPGYAYGELYVGIDCGRIHDLTVVWVLERGYDPDPKTPPHLRDVFRPVCVKVLRNMPFPAQEEAIRPIVTHPAICKGYIDMGSVGRALADAVADETGSVIEPYAMTPTRMAIMAERLRSFVQQNRIAQHPDDFIRRDVLCVHRDCIYNAGGTPRLVYQGSTPVSHGDAFWAQSLALQAVSESTGIGLSTSREVEMAQPQLALV
jgi:phage FluMu gp28-like protein